MIHFLQVSVRLTIYFDQHLVKIGRTSQNETFEMGYSSALVCLASSINTSAASVGLNVINEPETGIENMVMFNLSGPGSKCPVKFDIQIEVCQIGWIILEYSRTAMFHWMFLEVKRYNTYILEYILSSTEKFRKKKSVSFLCCPRQDFSVIVLKSLQSVESDIFIKLPN